MQFTKKKARKNVNEEFNAYIMSTKIKIDTVNKSEKSQKNQKQLLPPRIRKITQLTKQIS